MCHYRRVEMVWNEKFLSIFLWVFQRIVNYLFYRMVKLLNRDLEHTIMQGRGGGIKNKTNMRDQQNIFAFTNSWGLITNNEIWLIQNVDLWKKMTTPSYGKGGSINIFHYQEWTTQSFCWSIKIEWEKTLNQQNFYKKFGSRKYKNNWGPPSPLAMRYRYGPSSFRSLDITAM